MIDTELDLIEPTSLDMGDGMDSDDDSNTPAPNPEDLEGEDAGVDLGDEEDVSASEEEGLN